MNWSSMFEREAVAAAVEPFAMLLHRAKAKAAGVRTPSLAALAACGLRPRLPLLDDDAAAEHGWIGPLFAEHTGWHRRAALDEVGLFLDPRSLDGLGRLRAQLLRQWQVDAAAASAAAQADLLDPLRPETVAIYGRPLRLAQQLAREPQGPRLSAFAIVPLPSFIGVEGLLPARPPGLADAGILVRLVRALLAVPAADAAGDGVQQVYRAAAAAYFELARLRRRERGTAPAAGPG